jgi:hypothetical protein
MTKLQLGRLILIGGGLLVILAIVKNLLAPPAPSEPQRQSTTVTTPVVQAIVIESSGPAGTTIPAAFTDMRERKATIAGRQVRVSCANDGLGEYVVEVDGQFYVDGGVSHADLRQGRFWIVVDRTRKIPLKSPPTAPYGGPSWSNSDLWDAIKDNAKVMCPAAWGPVEGTIDRRLNAIRRGEENYERNQARLGNATRHESVVCEGILWKYPGEVIAGTYSPPWMIIGDCTAKKDEIRAQILKTCLNGKPCKFEALASVEERTRRVTIVNVTSPPVISGPVKDTVQGDRGGPFKGYRVGYRDIADVWNANVSPDYEAFVRKHLQDGTARLLKDGSSVWWFEMRDVPGQNYKASCVAEEPDAGDSCVWI